MIRFEEAYKIVMNSARETGTEPIPFQDSLGRVLAGDITSDTDMPPFDKSSVDGFACQMEDTEGELEVVETIPAGTKPLKSIRRGECARIMTGAMIPEGADCVIMVEDTETLPSGKIRFNGKLLKINIAFRAEDVRKNETVLKAGRLISPQDIAVMASIGHHTVSVAKMPVVGIISSGSELVEPWETPGPSQVRNSNAFQLMSQVSRTGASGKYHGIASDDPETTYTLVARAISESDIVLISGGVSMGDFDFVPSVLEQAGVKILFSRVAVQPGKPTIFGLHKDSTVFGLPGNPVSSFIQFELLVRPLLYKMMGYEWNPLVRQLPLKEKYSRKSAERMALVPVKIDDKGCVVPVVYHGSAHISALSEAEGIISVPVGVTTIAKQEIVSVRQI